MTDMFTNGLKGAPKRRDGEAVRSYRIAIYKGYERFWHWSQAFLILSLLFTGFGLHGLHGLLPFGLAVTLHTGAAVLLIALWVFTIFWWFTTGEWKQFFPKNENLWTIMTYYAWGILQGASKPYHKRLYSKQNPLQALTYVALTLFIGSTLWASGIAYLLYNLWEHQTWAADALTVVVFLHTAAAWGMALFVVIHVYMATTGKPWTHYIKSMITGRDDVELTEAEVAYLEERQGEPLKPSPHGH